MIAVADVLDVIDDIAADLTDEHAWFETGAWRVVRHELLEHIAGADAPIEAALVVFDAFVTSTAESPMNDAIREMQQRFEIVACRMLQEIAPKFPSVWDRIRAPEL